MVWFNTFITFPTDFSVFRISEGAIFFFIRKFFIVIAYSL